MPMMHLVSEPVSADFANAAEGERSKINGWVSQETQDKIKDLIPEGVLNALTRMVIVNAIYFKGNWDAQFDEKRTKPQDFKIAAGQNKSVPTMNAKKKYAMGGSETLERMVVKVVVHSRQNSCPNICAYAPTLASSNEDRDRFYSDLDRHLKATPQNGKRHLLGDFNTSAAMISRTGRVYWDTMLLENKLQLPKITAYRIT
ncbi:leukocyte elastase inhibitor [Elysia marginata]|uniref:Leukocyte elastase inhibitor n=1 Tax=Elysia marginata TaxID=1093978 RepID=A0AAV4G8N8_9GAST|nr:leukocyte elastase inhibitor [Elysia marginata]